MAIIIVYVLGSHIYDIVYIKKKKKTDQPESLVHLVQVIIEIIIILFCLIIAIVPEGSEICFSICITVYSFQNALRSG